MNTIVPTYRPFETHPPSQFWTATFIDPRKFLLNDMDFRGNFQFGARGIQAGSKPLPTIYLAQQRPN